MDSKIRMRKDVLVGGGTGRTGLCYSDTRRHPSGTIFRVLFATNHRYYGLWQIKLNLELSEPLKMRGKTKSSVLQFYCDAFLCELRHLLETRLLHRPEKHNPFLRYVAYLYLLRQTMNQRQQDRHRAQPQHG